MFERINSSTFTHANISFGNIANSFLVKSILLILTGSLDNSSTVLAFDVVLAFVALEVLSISLDCWAIDICKPHINIINEKRNKRAFIILTYI